MFAVITTSCTDDDNLEGNPDEGGRLRIIKMAFNKYLDNPSTFEYNSDNLLAKLTINYSNGRKRICEVQYDSENNPIKVIRTYFEYEGVPDNGETVIVDIQWTNEGYILKYGNYDYDDEQDTIRLDSQMRVIGLNDNYIFDWTGNDSLTVRYVPSNSIEKFSFNNYKHPWSGINIATILAMDISLGEWEVEWQNNYCLREYDDGSWTIRNEYTVNEQDYPTLMETRYLNTEENLPNEYMSFEYESY